MLTKKSAKNKNKMCNKNYKIGSSNYYVLNMYTMCIIYLIIFFIIPTLTRMQN